MSTTYALLVPTTEDLDLKLARIPVASLANFSLVSSSDNGKEQVATYRYGAGDATASLDVTARRSYNAAKDMTNNSVRVYGTISKTVSETGEVDYVPVDVILAWNFPGEVSVIDDEIVKLLSIACNMVFQELTGANGTPTAKVVEQFNHKIVTALL